MEKLRGKLIVILIVVAGLLFLRKHFKPSDTDPNDPNLLSGFEVVKIWSTSPEKGFEVTLSTDHVTQGKHSLKVKYTRGDLPSINTKQLRPKWGSYERVSFDVHNPHKEKIDFRVRLDDMNARRVSINRPLNPGNNKVSIDRAEIAAKIDPELIKFVVLYLQEPKELYTLYFDNFRLHPPEVLPGAATGKPDFDKVGESTQAVSATAEPAIPVRRAATLDEAPAAKTGRVKVALARLKESPGNGVFISSGVPFAPGQLMSEKDFKITDANGREIPLAARVLVRWPQDGSIRSVLVQLKFPIEHLYEYVFLDWGAMRQTKDLSVVTPDWRFPEGIIVMPPEWMCASRAIGYQLPMRQSLYDTNAAVKFLEVTQRPKTGSLREDGYYSNAHTYYQLYVRSGEMQYFIEARKELLHYRDNEIVLEGKDRGRAHVGREPRYIYMQAMLDDYIFTGDPRTLEVAGYMAAYLRNNFSPAKAFYPKEATTFWTERVIAFPFLGAITYYELTGAQDYLNIARQYMDGVYKTQLQWPSRGGFIHNLYAHDPDEGAKPDEYGGSPFMAGLLLEPIIKYHQITGSEVAADSVFRAVDWIINEGIDASGSALKYMTARKYASASGQPDLNMLVVHAFGYAWRLSGYTDERYLLVGQELFDRGMKDAFLSRRKQFNQNYRSSGHFLAYIEPGLAVRAQRMKETQESAGVNNEAPEVLVGDVLKFEGFESSPGAFQADASTRLSVDSGNVYLNGNSLKIEAARDRSNLAAGLQMTAWDLKEFPFIHFAYRLPAGVPVGMGLQTSFGDWVCIGGSAGYQCPGVVSPKTVGLTADGHWHEIDIPAGELLHAVLPGVERLGAFRFMTTGNAQEGARFWIDDFKIIAAEYF